MTKPKAKSKKSVSDEKMSLTKGQLYNIVIAAERKRGCCEQATEFIKVLKSEIKGKSKGKARKK